MDNHVTCPACRATISDSLIIEEASRNEGSGSRLIECECGEEISYWDIQKQLKKQKKLLGRIQSLFRSLFPSRSQAG